MSDHFSRVLPIVGPALGQSHVTVFGLPTAGPIIEMLVACGIQNWHWNTSDNELLQRIQQHHGRAISLRFAPAPSGCFLGVGVPATLTEALIAAQAAQQPAVLVAPPTPTTPCETHVWLPGDPVEVSHAWLANQVTAEIDVIRWRTAAPLAAGLVRAIILQGTDQAREDLRVLWDAGVRNLSFDHPHQPFEVWTRPSAPSAVAFNPLPEPRGTLLIAGLGSLGSVAALQCTDAFEAVLCVDHDVVEATNPVRQAYSVGMIGEPKALALARQMACQSFAVPHPLDEDGTTALLASHPVAAALVVTGTQADFGIARALRAANIPHIVGRCYPRAKYWEAMLIDGLNGPALEDLRGHLRLGPQPEPTPEQRAAYSDPTALDAEPATLIESGWAAAWLARLIRAISLPPGLRPRWLLELLQHHHTCLIGGVQSELTADGPAYGIGLPGQIRAWQRESIRRIS